MIDNTLNEVHKKEEKAIEIVETIAVSFSPRNLQLLYIA